MSLVSTLTNASKNGWQGGGINIPQTNIVKHTPYTVKIDTATSKTINVAMASKIGGLITIDWGDGNTTTHTTIDDIQVEKSQWGVYITNPTTISHTYSNSGQYLIKILSSTGYLACSIGSGVRYIAAGSAADTMVVDVTSWGSQKFYNMTSMFANCLNLVSFSATNVPNLSECVSLGIIFDYASKFNGDISKWDVSKVKDFINVFSNATSFNKPLANWNPRSATRMTGTFWNAQIYNQDLSSWCVSQFTSKPDNFDGATTNSSWSTARKPQWGTCPSYTGTPGIPDYPAVGPGDISPPILTVLQSTIKITPNTTVSTTAIAKTDITECSFFVSPDLPAGLLFNNSEATISGLVSVINPYAYNITAADKYGRPSNTGIFYLIGESLSLVAVNSSVNVTDPISNMILATAHGGMPPYRYSISNSAKLLTGGLTYSSDGFLSGTPNNTLTNSSYTITVTDSLNATATTTISISYVEKLTATIINPRIDFRVGLIYSWTGPLGNTGTSKVIDSFSPILITGGTAPYTCSITNSGNLSGAGIYFGVNLDNYVAFGMNSNNNTLGASTYTVTVTDKNGNKVSVNIIISAVSPNIVTTTSRYLDGTTTTTINPTVSTAVNYDRLIDISIHGPGVVTGHQTLTLLKNTTTVSMPYGPVGWDGSYKFTAKTDFTLQSI
jgi:hypothetical protein